MGLRQNAYAKVWSIRPNGSTYSGQISVGKKNEESGEYDVLFSGYVNFAGGAAKKARDLGLPEVMDRNNPVCRSIQITSSPDIGTWFNRDKYTKMIALIDKIKKYLSETEFDNLTHCVARAFDTKSITIWDFEIAEDYKNKKSNDSVKTKSKTVAREEIDEDDDLPF